MKAFKGRTAVITGAASGFGLEAARIAAREGMRSEEHTSELQSQ